MSIIKKYEYDNMLLSEKKKLNDSIMKLGDKIYYNFLEDNMVYLKEYHNLNNFRRIAPTDVALIIKSIKVEKFNLIECTALYEHKDLYLKLLEYTLQYIDKIIKS